MPREGQNTNLHRTTALEVDFVCSARQFAFTSPLSSIVVNRQACAKRFVTHLRETLSMYYIAYFDESGTSCVACILVVNHVLGCGGKLRVTFDDFLDRFKQILLRNRLPTRTNREHASLSTY